MAEISVIVPVYNVEPYIHRCVDSILSQTFTDFELILVDDGSPDNCGKICDEYAIKDSRVHVIHQENGGLSAARNTGIDWAFENSNNEWLTFIDSDDWVHEKYLEALHDAVLNTGCAVSICEAAKTEGENPFSVDIFSTPQVVTPEPFYCANSMAATVAWGKLYKKELFFSIRYPVGKIHEDEYVTYKILFSKSKLAFIPDALYAYYQNPEGITKTRWSHNQLDEIEPRKEQLAFFKCNGYADAFNIRIYSYASIISCHIHNMRILDPKDPKIKELRSTLRRLLRKIDIKNYTKERQNYIREAAYPIEMRFVRFFEKRAANFKSIYKANGVKGVVSKVLEKLKHLF